VRCPRCGNENSDENRFCGMCGGTLLPPAGPVATAPAQASPRSVGSSPASAASSTLSISAQPQAPAPRTSTPVSDEAPRSVTSISGPSFLGLGDPAPRKRGSLSIDPHAAPSSSNLDYLLEDEEEPKSGGAGKFILILLALALAVGLGYLRWKNHGFPSLGSGASKAPAAAQDSDATDTSSATMPAGSHPAAAPALPADNTVAGGAGAPAAAASTANPGTGNAVSSSPDNSAPANSTAPSNTAANPVPDAVSGPPAAAKVPAATAPDSPAATPVANPAPANPKPTASVERTAKPHAAIRPIQPVDPVAEAQKYIYGRGVTQDCDRGMRLLKPATDAANPAAMSAMGALYSAGLCTPHDLPTAYRWFALALRKDPDNMAVQTDLQKLWGEMTQPERQLAVKLSQ
jgi:hypothetical protein